MPISKRLVAQDGNDDNQWLKVDHSSRYITNDMDDWQFLFGPNSALSISDYVIKISARFDDETFNNLKVIAYLYDINNSGAGSGANCEFKFYRIMAPDWTEVLINTSSGVLLPSNNYFYLNPLNSLLAPIDFFGGDSLMIEASIVRSGITYRDRIYVNHLGIYDNVTRLRQDVDFLDITKVDE